MIQADKGTMMDWCGYVARDVQCFSHVLDADISHTAFVENVAYQFARTALHNLSRVCMDEETIDQVIYHAAQGLLRGSY
jgi:hypothetical protein